MDYKFFSSNVCSHCLKKFCNSTSKNNRHIRNVHGLPVEVKTKQAHIICPLCAVDEKVSLGSYVLLIKHLTESHNETIKQEILKFANNEEFETWRSLQDRNIDYVLQTTVQKKDAKIIYYNCNRSNSYGNFSNGT